MTVSVRNVRLVLYCIALVLLSSCSSSFLHSPFSYADEPDKPAVTVAALLPEALSYEDDDDDGEPFDYADESLEDNDGEAIRDLAVTLVEVPVEVESVFAEEPHYIERNEARYQAFTANFPELPVQTALALVNINADYGYYNRISIIKHPEELLVLCNKNFRLPEEYEPEGLRTIAGTSVKMADEAATAFEAMRDALKAELGLSLVAVSGHRSYTYQESLYKRYVSRDGAPIADTYSARAGHSEHQTGLAIDFLHRSASGSLRSAGFQNTAQYAWLQVHAHEYGFILRYPEGRESITGYRFEPWHWRYIGPPDAMRMFDEGFDTFEEYVGYAHVG